MQANGNASRRPVVRGKHAGRPSQGRPSAGRVPDWLSREFCARVMAGGLVLAIVGAFLAIIGYGHAQYRMTAGPQTSRTTVKFGWNGKSSATGIYPTGRVTDPQPIFTRVVDHLAMTADVTTANRPSNSPTLIGTLSDDSGWSHQWSVDTNGVRAGRTTRLSGTLDLKALLIEVAWAQATTGVSGPATLTLTVNENGGTSASGPSLSFAMSNVTLKPQGPLVVTAPGASTTQILVPATLTVSGHNVRISQLRHVGTVAIALGLLVALGAALLSSRLPVQTERDRLLRLFAGRIVHLTDAAQWDSSCLEVTEAESLAAFAASPGAVLYVVQSLDQTVLIAERGQTRLRYVTDARPVQPPGVMQEKFASPGIPTQRASTASDADPAESQLADR